MIALGLMCPNCGLPLVEADAIAKEPTTASRDNKLDDHLHIEMSGVFSCLNGHQWRAGGAFLLTREK